MNTKQQQRHNIRKWEAAQHKITPRQRRRKERKLWEIEMKLDGRDIALARAKRRFLKAQIPQVQLDQVLGKVR